MESSTTKGLHVDEYHSIRTYRDLLEALQAASEDQLSMPVQCVDSHPVDEYVHTLKKAICPDDHDESRDWTGPAQLIADQTPRNPGQGTLAETLASRIEKHKSQ